MKPGRRIVGVALIFLSAGGAYFYRSWFPDLAFLRVTEVVVIPEAPLKEEEITKVLPKLVGKNLLLLESKDVLKKVLENAWVASATIKKEFPSRLIISVQTKRPVAIRQEGAKLIALDAQGNEIDKWSYTRVGDDDLPLIGFEKSEHIKEWKMRQVVEILLALQKAIAPQYRVSQVVPSDPPYFKVFLASPSLEMLFSLHTWQTQLPFFVDLLSRPPRQIGQAHKINLVFPKKAVVSFPLSN